MILIVLTYMIFNTVYTFSDLTEKAYCNNNESYTSHEKKILYYNRTICCQNFENMTGKCKPCQIGYSSSYGGNCTPCSGNTYGIRCSKICMCNEIERCDHVIGCVQIAETTTYQKYGSKETGLYLLSTNTVDSTTQTNEGFVSKIAIYIACTGAISVGISYYLIWKKYMRRQQNRVEHVSERGNNNNEIVNTIQHTSVVAEENEPVYDEVDESILDSTSPKLNLQNNNHVSVTETPHSTKLKQHGVRNDKEEHSSSSAEITNESTCEIEICTEYSEPIPLTCKQDDDSYIEVEGSRMIKEQYILNNIHS